MRNVSWFALIWLGLLNSIIFSRDVLLPPVNDRPEFSQPAHKYRLLKKFSRSSQLPHPGILLQIKGTGSVRASAPGQVIKIGKMRGYGRYILVDHGKGWISMYSNMRTVKVSVSDAVNHRSILGTVRSSRLYFVVSYKGLPVNPAVVL